MPEKGDDPEPVEEAKTEPVKRGVGRPVTKVKRERTPAQKANDERQRARFKALAEARKADKQKMETVSEDSPTRAGSSVARREEPKEPEEPEEPEDEPVDTPPPKAKKTPKPRAKPRKVVVVEEEESSSDEEQVIIRKVKKKPTKKPKKRIIQEVSSSDDEPARQPEPVEAYLQYL